MIFFLPIFGEAQTYYNVTTTLGAQTVGGNTVSVSHSGYIQSVYPCGIGPYDILGGYYFFSFSQPISALRLHFAEVGYDDTVRVYFNSSPNSYVVTSSELSYYANTCQTSMSIPAFVVNGNIVGIGGYLSAFQFDAQPGYNLNSVQIEEATQASGFSFDFAFVNHCVGSVMASATNDTVCSGDSLHLFASGSSLSSSATYSWSGPNGFTSSIQNPIAINLATSGTYTVTVSDTGSCIYTSSQIITVKNLPTITVSTNSPLCTGDTLRLLANSSSSGIAYSWHSPNNMNYTSRNVYINNVALSDSGFYTITATKNGCSSKDTLDVAIYPKPDTPNISSNSPLCVGDSLILSATCATSGVNYNWTGPNNFNANVPDPFIVNSLLTDSGIYTVLVTKNGCTSTITTNVLVKPRPGNLSVSNNSPVCYGNTLSVSANSSSPGVVYNWVGPDSFNGNLQNFSKPNTSFADSGAYYLKAILNGCSSFDTTNIAVKPRPSIPVVSCNTQFCASDTLFLIATDTTSGVSYSWSGPNNFHDTVQNPVIANTQNADSGNYIVTAILNGCNSIPDTIDAIIYPIPADTIILNGSAIICSNIGDIILSTVAVNGQTYQWYENGISIPGANSSQYSATTAGSYNVHILNTQGCSMFTYSLNVIYAIAPYPALTADGDTLSTGNYATYQWNLNNNPVIGATNQNYIAIQNGSYSVTVTDSDGCSGTTTESYPINDLGVNKVNNKNYNTNVKIYPNPANAILNVESNERFIIKIMSIDGELQIQKIDVKNIDISNLLNGIYLIKVVDENGSLIKTEKLSKQ